jgi:hypothetical protein
VSNQKNQPELLHIEFIEFLVDGLDELFIVSHGSIPSFQSIINLAGLVKD